MAAFETNERRIYMNSLLSKTTGNDTDFTCSLGGTFEGKRLVLNSIAIDNYFNNFYGMYANLNIQLGTGQIITITPDNYVTEQQFIDYLNTFTNVEPYNLLLFPNAVTATQLEQWDYRLQIAGSAAWAPVNGTTGWTKLGFPTTGNTPSLLQTGTTCYDFSQSAAILVAIDNLENAITNQVYASFHIDNNSVFGGRLSSNQQIVFSSLKKFGELKIRLLDCDGNLLKTVQGNNNGIEIILNMSIFDK